MGEDGAIAIPEGYREALGVRAGEDLIVQFEDRELRLFTITEGVRRAQEIVRRYVPEGHSLSDELSAERRAEAERE